jgi:hypothetical protein
MMAIVLKFLGPLAPYLAAGGAAAGLLLYVMVLRHELADATTANAALGATNQADAAALAAGQKQQAAMGVALQRLDAQSQADRMATRRIATAITASSPGENGQVAPVLAQTLDSLRALQGGAP